MTGITEEILYNLAELPTEMQMETLDFIQFLKAKLKKNNALKAETKNNGSVLAEMLDNAVKNDLFAGIDDPSAWQREVRQDRPISGRE